MNIPTKIVSIGQMAGWHQATPDELRLIATQLNIAPCLTINSIPHYDQHDVERIGEILRNRPAEVATMQQRGQIS